jgi:hypothetical protein
MSVGVGEHSGANNHVDIGVPRDIGIIARSIPTIIIVFI